jgi:hypothetical protein
LLAVFDAVTPIGGVKFGAVDDKEFVAEQLQLLAQQHKPLEDLSERRAIVPSEVTDGFVVRTETLQEPEDLQIALGLSFQKTAGADAVEISIQVQLQ